MGSRAGGVEGGEGVGLLVVGEVINEGGDVNAGDVTAVFGTDFDGIGVADNEITAIARFMVVDATFEGGEEGGFAVEAATDDEGDTSGDAHAVDGAPVGEVEGYLEGFRGGEGDDAVTGEGAVIDAGEAGEGAAIGDEGDKILVGEGVAEEIGIFVSIGELAEGFLGVVGVVEGFGDDFGEVVDEHVGGLVAADAAALGGEANEEAGFDEFVGDDDGGAFEDFLAGGIDGEEAAFAGATALVDFVAGAAEEGGEGGFEAEAATIIIVEVRGVSGDVLGDANVHATGGGEGVALDIVDGKSELGELVGTTNFFISAV